MGSEVILGLAGIIAVCILIAWLSNHDPDHDDDDPSAYGV